MTPWQTNQMRYLHHRQEGPGAVVFSFIDPREGPNAPVRQSSPVVAVRRVRHTVVDLHGEGNPASSVLRTQDSEYEGAGPPQPRRDPRRRSGTPGIASVTLSECRERTRGNRTGSPAGDGSRRSAGGIEQRQMGDGKHGRSPERYVAPQPEGGARCQPW